MRALALVLAMLLSACANMSLEQANARIAEAQAYTRLACSFLPTAETVIAIVEEERADTAVEVANAICASLAERQPTVEGVPIEGQVVR